jgi:hypothetical protein
MYSKRASSTTANHKGQIIAKMTRAAHVASATARRRFNQLEDFGL